jgi:hypothetical protein
VPVIVCPHVSWTLELSCFSFGSSIRLALLTLLTFLTFLTIPLCSLSSASIFVFRNGHGSRQQAAAPAEYYGLRPSTLSRAAFYQPLGLDARGPVIPTVSYFSGIECFGTRQVRPRRPAAHRQAHQSVNTVSWPLCHGAAPRIRY